MADVHVVGAGPAGCIAAISALRSGFDVSVSEEHMSSGVPENCSGLFSRDGLESLSRFIDYRKFVLWEVRGADIHLPGQALSVRRRSSVGFVCDRAAFDQELARRAGEEGARMRYGERVRGQFLAPSVIGADGPLSSVARHFNFPPIRRHVATLKAVVPYRSPDPRIVEVHLSKSMFPGFFGWVIPRDEYTAEFGAGVSVPNRAIGAWNHLLRLKGIDSAPRPSGAVIPVAVRARTGMSAGGKKVLLAGDAAGQVKSTTGGGVVFGGSCAALAGRHAGSPLRYELEWRAMYGADLSMHHAIHRYLSGLTDPALAAFGRRLNKLNIDEYLSHHGHMDRPTRMLRPSLLAHVLKHACGMA